MFIKYGDNNPIDVNPKDFIDKTSNVESFDVFEKTNVDAALVASLFHFNEATVEDVRNECKKHGINVRRTR